MTKKHEEAFGDKDPSDAFDAGDEELKRQGRWFPGRRWQPDRDGFVADDAVPGFREDD